MFLTLVNALVKQIIEFNKNSYAKFTYCFRGSILFATESFDKRVELWMAVTMNDDNDHEMFINRIRMCSKLRTGKRVLKAWFKMLSPFSKDIFHRSKKRIPTAL